MSDLIDREEMKMLVNYTFSKPPFSRKTVLKMIDMARTVDAVPVIRCKDCKFHYDRTRCEKRIGSWFYDDYCNGAVRMDEDDFEH